MKSMTKFKAAILILPFLASCNKATISSSKRSADSCSFDYVLEKEAEINKYTAIESQSLSKDRTDKIIDLDYAIRQHQNSQRQRLAMALMESNPIALSCPQKTAKKEDILRLAR